MPHKHPDSPLGAFLAALREEKIPCILIGAMAAIEQGAPLTTIDYDFWVRLRERQYIRILRVIASKEAAGRDKDLAVLPVLRSTLALAGEAGRPGRQLKRSRRSR